jgi:hypothetical protein
LGSRVRAPGGAQKVSRNADLFRLCQVDDVWLYNIVAYLLIFQ